MKKTIKIYFYRLLRFLKITKPIELSKEEAKWIKLCKLHYRNDKRYEYKGNEWTDSLKPMFKEVYGWTAEDHPQDFLNCMFNKLFDIYLKIKDDRSGDNRQLKSVFNSAFYKGIVRNQEQPIERAIGELCGLIQGTRVIDENGIIRYKLSKTI